MLTGSCASDECCGVQLPQSSSIQPVVLPACDVAGVVTVDLRVCRESQEMFEVGSSELDKHT